MIEGHQWLVQNIGVKPRNTWSLDPFGYSSVLSYLYQRAGMENLVTLRAQAAVKERVERSRALEFRWRQHWDQGNATDILTLLMPYVLYTVQDSCGSDVSVCIQFNFGKVSPRHCPAGADTRWECRSSGKALTRTEPEEGEPLPT